MDHAGRRDRLRAALPDVDALLVTSLTNTCYLTGFTGSHGAVLVTASAGDDRLGTDFRYVTQVETECPGIEVVVDRNAGQALAAYAVSLGIVRLGIEAEHLTVAERDALAAAQPALELVPLVGSVEALRIEKDDDELAAVAEACRISDAALAALLHDMSANRYHAARVPNSAKHVRPFLTYSSMSQVCRYANRVSYEVLAQSAPRLTRALPEREDGLDEEAYWAR